MKVGTRVKTIDGRTGKIISIKDFGTVSITGLQFKRLAKIQSSVGGNLFNAWLNTLEEVESIKLKKFSLWK